MPAAPAYNLAIETSSRQGSITLGRGETLLASVELPQPRRHNVALMASVDQLLRQHGGQPEQLAEIYVSIGPGSFTGLRVACAVGQMLALAGDASLVPVPTLDVVAANVPEPRDATETLAVGLNQKGKSLWWGQYRFHEGRWRATGEPGLRRLDELLATAAKPLALLGDPLPTLDPESEIDAVRVLATSWAQPRSDAVWHLGRQRAEAGNSVAPEHLLPIYAREPEAVRLWHQRNTPQR